MNSAKRNRAIPAAVIATSGPMPVHVFYRCVFLTIAVSLLLVSFGSAAARATDNLDVTIQHLITYVRESGVQFERNFSSHNSVKAAEHIEKKYRHFRDEIDTPEKFIELCASASLITGKQYFVVTGQGEEIPAGKWLTMELERYRHRDR